MLKREGAGSHKGAGSKDYRHIKESQSQIKKIPGSCLYTLVFRGDLSAREHGFCGTRLRGHEQSSQAVIRDRVFFVSLFRSSLFLRLSLRSLLLFRPSSLELRFLGFSPVLFFSADFWRPSCISLLPARGIGIHIFRFETGVALAASILVSNGDW